ncbi:MAG: PaaI family thioesterase [Thauera sp.]|nr:PaaI family thioesterase [Thauera sp.]
MNAPLEMCAGLRSVFESHSMRTLDMRIVEAGDGFAKGRWLPPDCLLNGNGVVQGGFVGAACDQMMAAAIASAVGTQKFASINLQMTYHRAVGQEEYEVTAQLVRAGKRLAYLTAEVRRGDDLFVSCQSSLMLQGERPDPSETP